MALMDEAVFIGFADRIANQYSYIDSCFSELGKDANNDANSYYNRITTTAQPDIELALLEKSNSADEWFRTLTTSTIVKGYSKLTALIGAFDNSLTRDGSLTSKTWDGYIGNFPDLLVSDFTNQVYFAAKNTYLLAKNVWCEDEKILAVATVDAGGETLKDQGYPDTLFGEIDTDIAQMVIDGGFATQKATGSYFAGVTLDLKVTAGTAVSGVLNIAGFDETGTAVNEDLTLNALEVDGTVTTTNKYIDVTAITWVSGTFTENDAFQVTNTKLRTLSF